VIEDPDRCYQAAHSKDARFDGVFFIAVTSTGIYCRPSCPARTPMRKNVRFYPSAAAAQQAGFRACLRCRPDATPGSPEWNLRADVVARAMRLIRDGVIGTGPLAIARAQRSQTARVLLETTNLPISHIAFAAGFASVRQCNETVQQIFAKTPSALRARVPHRAARDRTDGTTQGIRLRLPGRRPLDVASVLTFFGTRAVPGIEAFDGTTYRRSLRLPHGYGSVALRADDESDGPVFVNAELHLSDLRDLTTAVARCRQLLDLDADPIAVLEALGGDPLLGPLVIADPGRRVPGAADGFELAVRAVIGQQVSVTGARTVAGRLVAAAGDALPEGRHGVTHLFPTPVALIDLAERDPAAFSMPASRRRALVALAHAVEDGSVTIDPGTDPQQLRSRLVALPGIGPWTAEYVAMRALRDPDAFMPTDLGILRAARGLGLPEDRGQLAQLTDRWRPWRSYAMAHLWSLPAGRTPTPRDAALTPSTRPTTKGRNAA
jgi:AraC family transcriptional regulator of adaptative response / DNA-3-methyladenine glycosylase II